MRRCSGLHPGRRSRRPQRGRRGPTAGPRHLNVFEALLRGQNGLVEGWIYDNAALAGWYAGPYSNGGASQETILRNTFGLKSIVGILSENRPNAGATRPGATVAGNEDASRTASSG